MKHRAAHTVWLLALGLFFGAAPAAQANPDLRKELAEVAKSLKQLLDGQNEEAIVVGQFTGPANFPTSAGPGIAQLLTEELLKLGKTAKKRAKYGVKGEYMATEVAAEDDPRVKNLAIKLKGQVEDEFGRVLTDFSFERIIKGEATFVELMGAPVELPPKATPEKRDRLLRESLTKPKTEVAGTRLCADADGKLAIELVSTASPAAPRTTRGSPSSRSTAARATSSRRTTTPTRRWPFA